MEDFEKLGLFYLGKSVNPETGKLEKNPLLYDSKDLTTHAVCVGMTGSGKTGLGIVLLEEAALDKIPSLVIDPKGDLTNLMLTFPNLSAQEFKPWIDPAEAERKGMTPEAYAEWSAQTWKKGLAEWGETGERIKNFRDHVELKIYTPANRAGTPISILSSFAPPSNQLKLDTGAVREKIMTTTSSLLGLLGIDADPLKSREFILISSLIQQAWDQGKGLDLATLVHQVQTPPFVKMGALDVDTFYPPKERMELSIRLNNLLASPGFQAWMEGDPLDIQQLLYTEKGKPKLSILSIAHLSDSERMFFVTLLLNELVSWMRAQPGTASLRAVLYMDEIFGFFPPTAMPPSKVPMLTLLKQARAFGIGIVLATQNPVDLDYKGLSNCGTWFIGKLQTARDKNRLMEGLKSSSGGVDAKALDQMLAMTGKRIFVLCSVHEKEPILFQTRWSLSYLRGPLTLAQIQTLSKPQESVSVAKSEPPLVQKTTGHAVNKPYIPPGIAEYFLNSGSPDQPLHYEPRVIGIAKVHFVSAKNKVDFWADYCVVATTDPRGKSVDWTEGKNYPSFKTRLSQAPFANATFGELPPGLMEQKNVANFAKTLATALYQTQTVTLYQTAKPKILSNYGESERDFRVRLVHEMREKRDEKIQKLREKYASKIAVLSEKVRRSQEKAVQKKEKAGIQKTKTMISFGSTLAGALFGRKITKGTINQTGTTLRKATQMGKEEREAAQAQKEAAQYQQQLAELESALNQEIAQLGEIESAENIPLEKITIRPRKSDISIEQVGILWLPISG